VLGVVQDNASLVGDRNAPNYYTRQAVSLGFSLNTPMHAYRAARCVRELHIALNASYAVGNKNRHCEKLGSEPWYMQRCACGPRAVYQFFTYSNPLQLLRNCYNVLLSVPLL